MDALALKRKMFEEMGEVAKADGAESLRARHAPPPAEEAPEEMAESEEVPGMSAEGEGGDESPANAGMGELEELLAGLSEEELAQLLTASKK